MKHLLVSRQKWSCSLWPTVEPLSVYAERSYPRQHKYVHWQDIALANVSAQREYRSIVCEPVSIPTTGLCAHRRTPAIGELLWFECTSPVSDQPYRVLPTFVRGWGAVRWGRIHQNRPHESSSGSVCKCVLAVFFWFECRIIGLFLSFRSLELQVMCV